MENTFDFIVVGGGAAGCVLAEKLSRRSSCLLLEAGGEDVDPAVEQHDQWFTCATKEELTWALPTVPLTGKRPEALAVIKESEEKHAPREATGFDLATVYAGLKDNDEAINWLEKDFETGNTSLLIYIAINFLYEQLGDDRPLNSIPIILLPPNWYAVYLMSAARFDEALARIRRA